MDDHDVRTKINKKSEIVTAATSLLYCAVQQKQHRKEDYDYVYLCRPSVFIV